MNRNNPLTAAAMSGLKSAFKLAHITSLIVLAISCFVFVVFCGAIAAHAFFFDSHPTLLVMVEHVLVVVVAACCAALGIQGLFFALGRLDRGRW